jgi:hypothetical protein
MQTLRQLFLNSVHVTCKWRCIIYSYWLHVKGCYLQQQTGKLCIQQPDLCVYRTHTVMKPFLQACNEPASYSPTYNFLHLKQNHSILRRVPQTCLKHLFSRWAQSCMSTVIDNLIPHISNLPRCQNATSGELPSHGRVRWLICLEHTVAIIGGVENCDLVAVQNRRKFRPVTHFLAHFCNTVFALLRLSCNDQSTSILNTVVFPLRAFPSAFFS